MKKNDLLTYKINQTYIVAFQIGDAESIVKRLQSVHSSRLSKAYATDSGQKKIRISSIKKIVVQDCFF